MIMNGEIKGYQEVVWTYRRVGHRFYIERKGDNSGYGIFRDKR